VGTYKYSAEFRADAVALADRTSRPARSLPLARLLQPPARALHDRLPRAGRLRAEINYAGHRCMTTGVHDQGGSPGLNISMSLSTALIGSSRMKANTLDTEGSRNSTLHQPDTTHPTITDRS
jgi:hypothetical protein